MSDTGDSRDAYASKKHKDPRSQDPEKGFGSEERLQRICLNPLLSSIELPFTAKIILTTLINMTLFKVKKETLKNYSSK